jgi:hypothetical protein
MSSAPVKERRGIAMPRWGWSGAAPNIPPKLSRSDIARVRAALPRRQKSIRPIVRELRALGGKFHRYLHQDEFGPSRAERMAALRGLGCPFHRLPSLLSELPRDFRKRLGDRLAESAPPNILLNMDIDDFEAYSNDGDAVWLVAEAAAPDGSMLKGNVAGLMANVANAAEEAAVLFSALDTTTAGELVDGLELSRLEVVRDEEANFAMVHARIRRLGWRVERALARLERRRGPEPAISLKWLVWNLCDLYQRETGKPVTSSAVVDYTYTGMPQSSAGRFVLACVEALRPSEVWVEERDHLVAQNRVRNLDKYTLRRGVYFAMRGYVANQPAGRPRRGRPKRVM